MTGLEALIKTLMKKREDAMAKVRAWWDAEALAGHYCYPHDAPAWAEYLDTCTALDEMRLAEIDHSMISRFKLTEPFEWAEGKDWMNARLLRQNGLIFRWNEIEIRYVVTSEDVSHVNWQVVPGRKPRP